MIHIYGEPNSADMIGLSFKSPVPAACHFSLLNLTGQEVYAADIPESQQEQQIQLPPEPSGWYVVLVSNDRQVSRRQKQGIIR